MSQQTVSRHHPALVALHWTLALLIVADLAIGSLVLVHIPNDAPKKIEALRAHMSGGIAILALMLARLAIRAWTATPADAPTGSASLDRLAWLSHRSLYVAIFAMAASGLALALQAHVPDVVWFGRGELPASFWSFPLRSVHYSLSRALMALIALHVAGALYHVLVRRDHLLHRMWFGRRSENRPAPPTAVAVSTSRILWRHASTIERLMLVAPTLLFVFIGWKYLSHPFDVAAGSHIVLGSPAAVTDTRAAGAVFLALGIATLLALTSTRHLLAGFALVAIVAGCVTVTRLLGVMIDGAAAETTFKLIPELVLTAASVIGLLLELGRRRHAAAAGAAG